MFEDVPALLDQVGLRRDTVRWPRVMQVVTLDGMYDRLCSVVCSDRFVKLVHERSLPPLASSALQIRGCGSLAAYPSGRSFNLRLSMMARFRRHDRSEHVRKSLTAGPDVTRRALTLKAPPDQH